MLNKAAAAVVSNEMRQMRGQGHGQETSLYDPPYGTALYGTTAAAKSYFGRGYPPMTFNPYMSPAPEAAPYPANVYNAGGYSRESFGRAMTLPQRRTEPYSSVGAAPYSTLGSPYSDMGSYYLKRDRLMGLYFGAGYSQLPSSFVPSRDHSDGSSAEGKDRKHPVASSISDIWEKETYNMAK